MSSSDLRNSGHGADSLLSRVSSNIARDYFCIYGTAVKDVKEESDYYFTRDPHKIKQMEVAYDT